MTGRGIRSVIVGDTEAPQHIVLGRLSEVGPSKNVCLDISKEHVVAIVGKRGSGKTHTLGVLIEGLALVDDTSVLGVNAGDRAMLVFDTLNLFQWVGLNLESLQGKVAKEQLARARSWELPLLQPEANLWHLGGSKPATEGSLAFQIRVSEMTPQEWGLLMDVDIMMEPMGQLITTAYTKVTSSGWHASAKRQPAVSNYCIQDLISCINEDTEILREYNPDTRRAVRQRLLAYDSCGLFSTQGTPLKKILVPGQVSVLLLGYAPEDLRTLVTFLIMRKLLELRMKSSEVTKDALIKGTVEARTEIPKTWVFVDEAQNIMPSRTATMANRELTRFVREGRNIGLSLAISTQQPQAIDPKVMSQVDTLIVHTLTLQGDINYVLNNIKSSLPVSIHSGSREVSIAEAIRELAIGQCLISAVESQRALFTEIRPRVTPHGGFEA
jgi:DNA helicase HerA-like ATPase